MAGQGGLSPIATGVRDAVARQFDGAHPVVVALSGGADSAVLAWALTGTVPLRAVSVDHRLPGSSGLMAAAGAIAVALGIEHTIVPAPTSGSSETELRRVRLAALEEAATHPELIATGHTGDDRAETVLGNVLRGAGTGGLAGIPRHRDRFIRPLLGIRRATTRQVAEELSLPYVDDPANADDTIRRNRLRNATIPSLAAEYNPKLVEALQRLADHAGADDEVLEERARRVPIRETNGGVHIPAAVLATTPLAVAARVARRALRMIGGPYAGTSDEIAAVLAGADARRSTISGGVEIMREGPWVTLVANQDPPPHAVAIDRAGLVSFGAWQIGAEPGTWSLGRFDTVVDGGVELHVRAPEPTDAISIGSGSKRVSAALAEARIPGRLRPHWPVVATGETIVWIPGVRSAPTTGSLEGTRLFARRSR